MISFYGSSDDLAYLQDEAGNDYEFSCWDKPAVFKLEFGNDSMFVIGVYGAPHASGCWTFAPQQSDEGKNLPDWELKYQKSPDCEYSLELEIDCPPGTIWTQYFDEQAECYGA